MAARGVNKVILVGHLGQDPEVRYMPNGGAVVNLTLATSETWRDKQTGEMRENTEWHRVVMFGKLAEVAGEYLMREDKDRSYEKLVDTMLSIKIDKLRAYLQNTPAANLVEEKIEKTAISIRAVLTNYVKAIRYLQGIEKNGEPFTIRDWMRSVREDQPNGWLFISSNADTHASLKPVIRVKRS